MDRYRVLNTLGTDVVHFRDRAECFFIDPIRSIDSTVSIVSTVCLEGDDR